MAYGYIAEIRHCTSDESRTWEGSALSTDLTGQDQISRDYSPGAHLNPLAQHLKLHQIR